jgi:putative transposase
VEKGPTVVEGSRRNNISDQTYYNWKRKYGGMPVDEAKKPKAIRG